MKNLSGLLIVFLFLSFSLSEMVKATDLRFSKILVRSYWENEREDSVEVEIENANVLTADNYSVKLEIKDWQNNLVFQDFVEPGPIQPFTTLTVKSNITWTPTLTGTYTLTGEIDFFDDIDTTNNKASADFPVVWGLDIAVSKFRDWSIRICPDTNESWGFMPQEPLKPGTVLESEDPSEFKLSLNDWKYYGYLDCYKTARYSHLGYAFTMDAIDSSEVDTFRVNYWTKIDGIDYMAAFSVRVDTPDAVFGSEPDIEVTDTASTISNTSTSQPADSVCALLISGEGKDPEEQRAFDFDVELMKNNLMLESLGPRLPSSSIQVLNNPSTQEICDAIAALTGNYRKLTLYYSGHGWLAGFVTKDDSLKDWPGYFDLSEKLNATGIKELELIIDACHAGAAIGFFDGFTWRDKDVTIVAACGEDTVSYTRRLFITGNGDTIRVGAYTWYLMKCFGDPQADKDTIPGVSWKEAYEWVKANNEMFGSVNVNKDMMPQLYVHKAVKPKQPVTTPPDTDAEITTNPPQDTTVTFYVDMRTDFDDFTTIDTNIVDFSTYRYWSYSSSALEGSFTYNLKLNYTVEFDTFSSSGEPGLLFRDSAGVKWEKYDNYTWSDESTYVQGFGINKYGDFALATVKIVTDINDNLNVINDYKILQNYPNPFNPETTIEYFLPENQFVNISVYDVLGRLVAVLINEEKKKGKYLIRFNSEKNNFNLASGLYIYSIKAGDFINSKKMILLK